MGRYVNPQDMSKEEFLKKYGKEISVIDFKNSNFNAFDAVSEMVVVLVDNGPFKAALICYDDAEYRYIVDNPDPRPKKYYSVNLNHLAPYL